MLQTGVRVVSASYGGTYESIIMRDAIAGLRAAGILLVAAASNDAWDADVWGQRSFPASYLLDNVISVAATTPHDDLASFSNWGATRVRSLRLRRGPGSERAAGDVPPPSLPARFRPSLPDHDALPRVSGAPRGPGSQHPELLV